MTSTYMAVAHSFPLWTFKPAHRHFNMTRVFSVARIHFCDHEIRNHSSTRAL